MKIKKRDSQRMVIAPTRGTHWWVVVLALASFALYIIFRPLGIVVIVITVLFAVGQLVGNRIVLDKATQSITIEKRRLLLIRTRRVIPFSTVQNVDVGHKLQKRGEPNYVDSGGAHGDPDWHWEKTWQLSIDAGSNKVEIDLTRESISQKGRIGPDTVEADMWHLVSEIRRFIGTEQLLKRQKEATRAKDAAREEAVVSFKRRREEAAKERKRQKEEELFRKRKD